MAPTHPTQASVGDRELLELAAMAAGYDHLMWTSGSCPLVPPAFRVPGEKVFWNPLTDDGDALRLAVKLRMKVEGWFKSESACAYVECGRVTATEPHYGDDPCRATRRAIVYAAAAIARATSLPNEANHE